MSTIEANEEVSAAPAPSEPINLRTASEIEAERLERKKKAREASGWQPIETAPNDEPVLVSAWLNNQPGVERFVEIARLVFGEWVEDQNGDPIWQPTHWMPLPEPPK